MYTHSLLIVVSLIFVCLAPIVYIRSLQKRKQKNNIRNLILIARENKLKPDIIDSLPNLLLGLDTTSGKLLVIENLNGTYTQIFDLRDLNSCEIRTSRSASGGINRIASEMLAKGRGSTGPQIVFYNEAAETYPNIDKNLEKAIKWKDLIQEKRLKY